MLLLWLLKVAAVICTQQVVSKPGSVSTIIELFVFWVLRYDGWKVLEGTKWMYNENMVDVQLQSI